jgi:hypothetical protein
MANIETFFGDRQMINLTASVGEKGVNLKDDVMVVQAMLRYAVRDNPIFQNHKMPAVTGAINNETKILIRDFQRFLKRIDKQDVAVDGLINRAVGEKPYGKRGQWTILCLNDHVGKARLLSGGEGNEYEDLCRRFPQLHAVLDGIPVGSLGLSLEPPVIRLGTLDLALE